MIGPSVLAVRFGAEPAWQRFRGPALAFGPVMFIGVLTYLGLHGRDGAGYAQRALALAASAASAAVVLLALATRRVLGAAPDPASHAPLPAAD